MLWQTWVTYCKHTRQEVSEDVVSQVTSSQNQLFGLVVAGELQEQNTHVSWLAFMAFCFVSLFFKEVYNFQENT